MIHVCPDHLASWGNCKRLTELLVSPACHGKKEAKIREELVRSALLIPHLFAPHNILKVSDYTSGRA